MSAVLDALVSVNGRAVDMIGQVYAAYHHDLKIGTVGVRLNVKSALKSAREIVAALEAAERSLDDSAPSSVVDFNKAPEAFEHVGSAGSRVVSRLVPRGVPVKSAGTMGTTTPGGDAA